MMHVWLGLTVGSKMSLLDLLVPILNSVGGDRSGVALGCCHLRIGLLDGGGNIGLRLGNRLGFLSATRGEESA